MRFKKLGVVARGGIEPPTRGFSVRRSARFGASKPKNERVSRRPTEPPRPTEPMPNRKPEDLTEAPRRPIRFNGLRASRPNAFRTLPKGAQQGPASLARHAIGIATLQSSSRPREEVSFEIQTDARKYDLESRSSKASLKIKKFVLRAGRSGISRQ